MARGGEVPPPDGDDFPPDGRDLLPKRPHDPLWPSEATSQGQMLRLTAGLSSPGNPRRVKRMFLALFAGLAVCALVIAAFAIAG